MRTGSSGRRRKMRRSLYQLLPFAVPATASMVSLSSFSPYSSNLTPSCEAVYTTPISGCKISDFDGGGSCSDRCVDGLLSISTQVYEKCRGTQDYQLLIAQFLNGNGITTLCPGVVVVTASPPPTHKPTSTHYRQHPDRIHGVSTVRGSSFPTTGIITDSGSPPCVSSTCTNPVAHETGKAHHTSAHHPHGYDGTTTAHSRHPTSSASRSRPTGSGKHCDEYGGDPFSSCKDTFSHNGSSTSRKSIAAISWMILIGAILMFTLLLI